MRIRNVQLPSPFAVAPMAGMTDSAFRRLVKRQGGCGLVVTEMVSSEGLVRGIDRTLEYAEYTEEERPVSIQIFGGDPAKMAEAARIVQDLGADIVDVNMGCPVPKIAKHSAGCSLMREPSHAAAIIEAMAKEVTIPVTVKMRAGWNDQDRNAPTLARMVEDAGAAAIAVHGRTAAQSYSGHSDWEFISTVAESVSVPVFGSGDVIEPEQAIERLRTTAVSGVLVGRGVLRNPWILAQAQALAEGREPRAVTHRDRGQFLLDYIDLLLTEGEGEADGFRHTAGNPGTGARSERPAQSRERWVINKLRALNAWYTKGIENGSHLRTAINACESLDHLRAIIARFFFEESDSAAEGAGRDRLVRAS
ncbi:MAG TPA: tRNA dihydrouridine synthase DusB [Vicinamibacterales bacterium]